MNAFENRLAKNARHFFKWARAQKITAFRLYDRDMPEAPFVVEWYDGRVHLVEFPSRRARKESASALDEAAEICERVLEVPRARVYRKQHTPHAWGESQYERRGEGSERFTVEENGLKFWVNLGDFLDTGLFLDHRNTRARVRDEARGRRVLNLFSYTGSFSVYAAAGGAASTTSVDLSKQYGDWAADNFEANRLPAGKIVRADVLAWLRECREEFDLIVLDPPSFSTSKKMERRFEVQRDHPKLLSDAFERLAPKGVLYFSTNYRGFELDPALRGEELTPRSIPADFHDRAIHRCWRFVA